MERRILVISAVLILSAPLAAADLRRETTAAWNADVGRRAVGVLEALPWSASVVPFLPCAFCLHHARPLTSVARRLPRGMRTWGAMAIVRVGRAHPGVT